MAMSFHLFNTRPTSSSPDSLSSPHFTHSHHLKIIIIKEIFLIVIIKEIILINYHYSRGKSLDHYHKGKSLDSWTLVLNLLWLEMDELFSTPR